MLAEVFRLWGVKLTFELGAELRAQQGGYKRRSAPCELPHPVSNL